MKNFLQSFAKLKIATLSVLLFAAGFFVVGTTDVSAEENSIYDIDGNGKLEENQDGMLVFRYLAGQDQGDVLISEHEGQSVIGEGATRTSAEDIAAYIESIKSESLDIDGNGKTNALNDGVLLIRYMKGMIGEELTADVVASDATRKTAEEIISFIEGSTETQDVSLESTEEEEVVVTEEVVTEEVQEDEVLEEVSGEEIIT